MAKTMTTFNRDKIDNLIERGCRFFHRKNIDDCLNEIDRLNYDLAIANAELATIKDAHRTQVQELVTQNESTAYRLQRSQHERDQYISTLQAIGNLLGVKI
jgi:hypothetical protein